MLQVTFSKRTAENFMRALDGGRTLTPNSGAWSPDDLFMLAGAALHMLLLNHPKLDVSQPEERVEAIYLNHEPEARAAVDYCQMLSMAIQTQTYDAEFDPVCKLSVQADGTDASVTVFEGKHGPSGPVFE